MRLVSWNVEGSDGSNDVTYQYQVRNVEDDLTDVMIVDDKLGLIDGPTGLAMGETRAYTRVVPIYQDTTNEVVVTGVGPGGLECEASATATVLVAGGGGDFACEKPLDALTMIWDGTEPTVSVQAWKDMPGEIDLGFYPGINIGDEVTVTVAAGGGPRGGVGSSSDPAPSRVGAGVRRPARSPPGALSPRRGR